MAIIHCSGVCLVTECSSDEFVLNGATTRNVRGDTLSRAYVFGREIFLSENESDVLELLMAHPGRIFSRDEILDRLGDSGDLFMRSIDQIIKRLRRKLFPKSKVAGAIFIETVYSLGYRVVARKKLLEGSWRGS